jgi:hypothetical protein
VIDCVVVNRRFIHTSSLEGAWLQFFFEFDHFGPPVWHLPLTHPMLRQFLFKLDTSIGGGGTPLLARARARVLARRGGRGADPSSASDFVKFE